MPGGALAVRVVRIVMRVCMRAASVASSGVSRSASAAGCSRATTVKLEIGVGRLWMRRALTVTRWPTASGRARWSGKLRQASSSQPPSSAPSRSGVAEHRAFRRHAHAQALGGARELQFLHDAVADQRESRRRRAGGELDLLRPDHGDDLARRDGFRAGALEVHAVAAAVAEQQVCRAEEGGDEAGARARVQVVRRADLEQAALVHHADAVGHREGLVLVVGDEDRGDAELLLDPADRAPQLLADLGVERAEGLVEQQHLGPVRERARDGDALLLAAGELGREALVHALEGDELQQLLAAHQAVGALHAPHPQRELDVVRDAHVAEQGVVLEHEADPAVAGGDAGHVPAVQRDTRPWSISTRPAMARSSVLLPLPDGPSSTRNSPCSISSETSLTTGSD